MVGGAGGGYIQHATKGILEEEEEIIRKGKGRLC